MSNFLVKQTPITDLVVIEPTLFADKRGYFMETYHQDKFCDLGLTMAFVQDNESSSVKGVLRGLHFQTHKPQGKLVRTLKGSVFDVAVDLRIGSPTYCQWHGEVLSAENRKMLYVPEGFAHGFLVLENALISYKCTNYYAPQYDSGVRWNDPDLEISWPLEKVSELILSEKDKSLNWLKDIEPPFQY